MRVIIQLTADEYSEYVKNCAADMPEEVDLFIKDCLSDHAAVFIYDADVRVTPILPAEKDISAFGKQEKY
jgi:hypothetical protein